MVGGLLQSWGNRAGHTRDGPLAAPSKGREESGYETSSCLALGWDNSQALRRDTPRHFPLSSHPQRLETSSFPSRLFWFSLACHIFQIHYVPLGPCLEEDSSLVPRPGFFPFFTPFFYASLWWKVGVLLVLNKLIQSAAVA